MIKAFCETSPGSKGVVAHNMGQEHLYQVLTVPFLMLNTELIPNILYLRQPLFQ